MSLLRLVGIVVFAIVAVLAFASDVTVPTLIGFLAIGAAFVAAADVDYPVRG